VFIGVTTGFNSATNVLVADSPDETDFRNCIVVNLPNGTDLRRDVSLSTNPSNVKKSLAVSGVLRTYFGLPGLRDAEGNSSDFILDGQGSEPPIDSDPDPVPALAEDFESFATASTNMFMSMQPDNKGWRGVSVQGTLEPDMRISDGNKFVNFSAHRTTGVDAGATQEFWLISPRLDLNAATKKTFSVDLMGGFFNENTEFKIYVLDGVDPATATKTELTNWRKPTIDDLDGQYTPWLSSGEIDLSAHSGIIRIGFYYKGTSGTGNSTTYRMDNFIFGDASITPPPPPAEITDTLASWTFSAETDLANLTATGGSGIITRSITTALNFTASNRTIWCNGWHGTVGQHWLITIPVNKNVSGDVLINFRSFGTATSPRDWRVQVSSDNLNWTNGDTYTLTADIASQSVKATLPATIPSGSTMYIRLITTSLTSIGGGTVASNGNSRLADVTIGL
jgi:hypothetical protein